MSAYYNEIDPYAAQWLRNLIAAGVIAPGEVDERDMRDVAPCDLFKYTQVHLCAGIGIWSYSLRSAGWNDDRPCWTGSFPCQPFSAAGKGAGFDDERHLWPSGLHLIKVCNPDIIFGEQVSGKNGLAWLDLVQTDLEGLDYAVGAVPAPAAGFGAPHIRERLYWVAYTDNARSQGRDGGELPECPDQRTSEPRGSSGGLAEPQSIERDGTGNAWRGWREFTDDSDSRRLDDAAGARRYGAEQKAEGQARDETRLRLSGAGRGDSVERPGPTNGFWRDADWLLCTDGKWRPVEPGTFPLVDGTPNRIQQLRAYGNAICAPQAAAFIEAAMAYRP